LELEVQESELEAAELQSEVSRCLSQILESDYRADVATGSYANLIGRRGWYFVLMRSRKTAIPSAKLPKERERVR
jgi:hypothetical protein